jgi:peptidoglycan/xylan/chitin deacetylase (PgdA/CDA1 family)
MAKLKESLNGLGPDLIEKIGTLINPFILNFKNEGNQLLVFYFHGLFETESQRDFHHVDPQHNMTKSQFEEFIEYFLRHNFKFIVPEDLTVGLQKNQPYAMITFDDGYYSNIMAAEVLEKYKIPGCIFISTKNVTENQSYWWDIIYKYRHKQGNSLDKIRSEQRMLKAFKHSYISDYISQNFGKEAFNPWSDIDRPFTGAEVKKISENPLISIGNHTHNHAILTNYSREEMLEELTGSNKILTDLTGMVPVSVAFPNGNYNNTLLEVTEELGFQYAFTVEPKKNQLPLESGKLICLSRYMTNTTKINKFGSFCRLGYEPDTYYTNFKNKIKSIVRVK